MCQSLWEVSDSKIIEHPCPHEGRAFGITWNNNHLFLSRPDRIDVLNHSFKFSHSLQKGINGDLHQIAIHQNTIWSTCPRLNCLASFDLNTNQTRFFLPVEERWCGDPSPITNKMRYETGGAYHYNSLLIKDDNMYVMANNNSFPSFILQMSLSSMKIVNKLDNIGTEAHNLCFLDKLFFLDSRGRRAIVSEDCVLPVEDDKHFIRGLAATETHFFVGVFPFRTEREERRHGDSYIYQLTHKGEIKNRILLSGAGDICDIRCVDEYDFAHGIHTL